MPGSGDSPIYCRDWSPGEGLLTGLTEKLFIMDIWVKAPEIFLAASQKSPISDLNASSSSVLERLKVATVAKTGAVILQDSPPASKSCTVETQLSSGISRMAVLSLVSERILTLYA